MYNREVQLRFHRNHREERNAYRRDRYYANRAKENARTKRYIKANPQVTRGKNLKRAYGITLKEYNELVAAQHGLCAMCHKPPKGNTPKTSVLHVDHDHITGNNRDLLCWSCNVGLGMLKDSPDLCEAAAVYLRRHNAGRT